MKKLISLLLVIALLAWSGPVFAWGGHSAGGRGYHGGRGHSYHYHGGRYYDDAGLFVFGVLATALVVGAIVDSIPPRHEVVVVQGTPYYHDGNVYYRSTPNGYVVVPSPQPVVVLSNESPSITLPIQDYNGVVVSVTLVRKGTGWVGPQGEYYPSLPSRDQLRALYGK